jgi:hypothetical protein
MTPKFAHPTNPERQTESCLLHMTPTLRRRIYERARKHDVSQTQVILQLVQGALDLLDRQEAEAEAGRTTRG